MKRVGLFSLLLFASAFPLSLTYGKARKPPEKVETKAALKKKAIRIPARRARLPFYVYGDKSDRQAQFVPSGFMGDVDALEKLSTVYDSAPVRGGEQGDTALRVRYTPKKGVHGWTGLYWLSPANNWGKIKGAGFDLSQAKRVSFWMRGEKGGERIANIRVGGVEGQYPDSDSVAHKPIRLSKEWTQYFIELDNRDMRHIVGGFSFLIRQAQNPRGAMFYVDEIVFE